MQRSRLGDHRQKGKRRGAKKDSDPEFRPIRSRSENSFPCRRSTRLSGKIRAFHEQTLSETRQLIHLNDSQETASEISDFLDLEDDMFSDLDLFEGVDFAPSHVSVVMKTEFISAVAVYSPPEENLQVERLRTPTKEVPKRKRASKKPPRESLALPSSSREVVVFDPKNLENKTSSGRRKTSNHVCAVCEKTFQQLGHLRSHILLHTGERPFVCEICGKCFAQSGHLISHINSHTSNRPYRCDFCEKRFTQSGHKRNHERSHLGIRPYGCEHCDKRFTQSGHLVNHLRIHNGEKPYECDFCGKKFTQSGHLSSHMKTHHNPLDFSLNTQLQEWLPYTLASGESE